MRTSRASAERPKPFQTPATGLLSPSGAKRSPYDGGASPCDSGAGIAFRFADVAVDVDRASASPRVAAAGPESSGSSERPDQPFGEFNEEGGTVPSASPDVAAQPPPQPAAVQTPPLPSEASTAATSAATANSPPAQAPAQAPAAAPRLVIRGPRELWYFDNQTPAGYSVSAPLTANRRGGTFQWTASPHLTLSSATDPAPTVTTAQASASPGRDAWIRLRHTAADGTAGVASYALTVLAPDSLTHLRNVDNPHATWTYESRIHYSIMDQMGTVLPRNVPINEQWTGGIVADHAGMNWRRGAEGAATVNPADWNDWIGGENVAFAAVPTPVTAADPAAGTAVYHWPGDWRVGSLTIGSGRRVRSVTWQKNRGFARHT